MKWQLQLAAILYLKVSAFVITIVPEKTAISCREKG